MKELMGILKHNDVVKFRQHHTDILSNSHADFKWDSGWLILF